jgi:hypothetical protein
VGRRSLARLRAAPPSQPGLALILAAGALAVACLALPGSAAAHTASLPGLDSTEGSEVSASSEASVGLTNCTDSPTIDSPDKVFLGEFRNDQEGSYVMLPFGVPEGTDAVRVEYCHDQPLTVQPGEPDQVSDLNQHTIDLGLYETRDGSELWSGEEFRGWGGSSRPDVTVSPESTIGGATAQGTQKTTVGFLPGPIPAGQWAVELGIAAVADETIAEDGKVQWRVEVDLIDDPAYSDEPYQPVPYDPTPARTGPGWYAGDFHVHARHSNPADATMKEAFDYAFAPLGQGAGLDFITLSDYVTTRHWGEIGAFQAGYPGRLIIRSAEVITYRGHVNNHASLDWADYRTGPVYEANLSGTPDDPERTLTGTALPRGPRPASAIFDEIHAGGGWTQINHPETFPSEVPTFGSMCRGCSWEYSDTETDYRKVDAIEVATGPAGLQQDPEPGPNPFTPLQIQFWEDAIDANGLNSNHIAAVGSSDSHKAGGSSLTSSPIGQGTTVVRAGELSEKGIQEGVEAGHTYVKIWGNDGPDLRFEATFPGPRKPKTRIMGDTVRAEEVSFTARVLDLDRARTARDGLYTLLVLRNGLPFLGPIPLTEDETAFSFASIGPARYRLQVERTLQGVRSIEAVSSPIYHEPPR